MQRMEQFCSTPGLANQAETALVSDITVIVVQSCSCCLEGSNQTERAVVAVLRRSQYICMERERSVLGVKPEQRHRKKCKGREWVQQAPLRSVPLTEITSQKPR